MKTIYKSSAVILLFCTILFSCKKDFLNTKPLDQVSASVLWTDAPLATAFVNDIYSGLQVGGFYEQMIASLTDEATFTHTGRNINTIMEGSASASNTGWLSDEFNWYQMWRWIRAANIAITNLKTATFDNEDLKKRLTGEAQFLRAFYYNQLLMYYGSFPIITKVYGLNEDYNAARNSYAECVDFIIANCDTAITVLTGRTMDKGRATALAAKALKAKVLLHAASDLHDVPTAKSKSATLSSYANPELFGYVSGDRNARWQKAKDAAKVILDEGKGYKLDLSSPVSVAEGKTNYISLSMAGYSKAAGIDAAAASELIFGKFFNRDLDPWNGLRVGLFNGPNGYHNWAGNTPLGLLVDDYEMADGTPFSWNNPAHNATPYANRDPRFYATILYDGADWKPRNIVSGNVDPANQIQTGKYDLIVSGEKIIFNGLDTRNSSIEDWNGSRTGYYMRKFTDPDAAIVESNDKQIIPWPFFRYTEFAFNYAEACIELGQYEEAKLWLNRIRYRAGMPAVTENGPALRDRLRQEKRVEMVFEEVRYHDARRWMIAPATLGRKSTFINITGTFKPGKTMTSPYRYDPTVYNYAYTPYIDNAHENRKWDDKMYFSPFANDELKKNNKLIQNPGYQ